MVRILKIVVAGILAFGVQNSFGKKVGKVDIQDEIVLSHTTVKSQGSTGTCWSFATTSFLESELIRMGKGEFDLSEMYFVSHAYLNKSRLYMYLHGKSNFSQGGQAHDVIDVIRQKGIVTDKSYPGVKTEGRFSHKTLMKALKAEVEKTNKKRNFSYNEDTDIQPVINNFIGRFPKNFKWEGEKYDARSFTSFLEINPDDYIELTSYSHHPFYSKFILEVPDNWSNSMYYNLPIDKLMEVMKYSIENGFTVCWDGDTSEKTFEHKKGLADLPSKFIGVINQDLRQETFLNRKTTDDHLMHIVGLAKDENGRLYFNTKNSWGTKSNKLDGMLYMSEDYVMLKTVAIMVHKNAIPKEIAKKLHL